MNEHSASGLGRAFSGDAAIADNAAVLARNPAAMALFDRMQLSGSLSVIDPSIDVSTVDFPAPESYDDIAPAAVVPAAFFIQPLDDQFAWGDRHLFQLRFLYGLPDRCLLWFISR
ncbi:long-chain fatty acid transport protein [Photobacterium aphoticum]|uniref:Long-chain fatty acid transport protein n=1 Tax=Photobacterium aphoticum TaxID=754436 RepID=A0A090QZ72_9GAMM|nr:long-chain fatty acid transport protein [Photobacterium aphoticum]